MMAGWILLAFFFFVVAYALIFRHTTRRRRPLVLPIRHSTHRVPSLPLSFLYYACCKRVSLACINHTCVCCLSVCAVGDAFTACVALIVLFGFCSTCLMSRLSLKMLGDKGIHALGWSPSRARMKDSSLAGRTLHTVTNVHSWRDGTILIHEERRFISVARLRNQSLQPNQGIRNPPRRPGMLHDLALPFPFPITLSQSLFSMV